MLLLLEFRTKAPGARTIAQFVHYRFGPIAHIVTIVITLTTGIYSLLINVSGKLHFIYLLSLRTKAETYVTILYVRISVTYSSNYLCFMNIIRQLARIATCFYWQITQRNGNYVQSKEWIQTDLRRLGRVKNRVYSQGLV